MRDRFGKQRVCSYQSPIACDVAPPDFRTQMHAIVTDPDNIEIRDMLQID
jgi:hypothetical protein